MTEPFEYKAQSAINETLTLVARAPGVIDHLWFIETGSQALTAALLVTMDVDGYMLCRNEPLAMRADPVAEQSSTKGGRIWQLKTPVKVRTGSKFTCIVTGASANETIGCLPQ